MTSVRLLDRQAHLERLAERPPASSSTPIRLAMKPGVSLQRTTLLPSRAVGEVG